jgi:ParB family transcriptional regulator, chromosome partitioning protein
MTAAKVQTISEAAAGYRADILIANLRTAPWNARKSFDESALAELAASIRQQGVLIDLIVRPISGGNYEIVAGERRSRAAKLAGKAAVPCNVRELTDDQAREVGLVENLQREGLPPMEEAEGLGELMKRPGATIDTVAAQIGKGKTYVGQRLQLLKAIVPVSEALKAGAIELAHAFVLARLSAIQQARFLDTLNCGYNVPGKNGAIIEAAIAKSAKKTHWRPSPHTVATLRDYIERSELRVLADAPFPLDSAELPPMPCTACPKRSINAGLLFSDLAKDTCTDRSCFDRKVRGFIAGELETARKEKRTLLRMASGYGGGKGALNGYDVTEVKTNACGHADEAIYIDGDKAGKKLLICRGGSCKTHGRGAVASRSGSSGAADVSTKKKRAKVAAEKKFRRALFNAIAKQKLPATINSPGWFPAQVRLAAYAIGRSNSQYFGALAEALGWDVKVLGYGAGKTLEEKLGKLPHPDVIRAALLASESSELGVNEFSLGKADGLLALAKMFGVDAAKVRKAAEQPVAAKTAAKPTEKKPALAAAARKRIVEAQKKRWAALRKKAGRK